MFSKFELDRCRGSGNITVRSRELIDWILTTTERVPSMWISVLKRRSVTKLDGHRPNECADVPFTDELNQPRENSDMDDLLLKSRTKGFSMETLNGKNREALNECQGKRCHSQTSKPINKKCTQLVDLHAVYWYAKFDWTIWDDCWDIDCQSSTIEKSDDEKRF